MAEEPLTEEKPRTPAVGGLTRNLGTLPVSRLGPYFTGNRAE
jgi:hypothetical protein